MISVVVWLVHDARSIYRLSRRTEESEEKERERKEALKQLMIGYIGSLADLQLAIYFCFPDWKNNWSSKWVGVFGMINGLVGIYKRWPK